VQLGVKSVVDYAVSTYGRIDILVNNAGIFEFSFVEDMEEAFLDNMIRVNFFSQFFMIKECVRYMKNQKFGRIVNASSISSALADVGLVAYGASKAAVNMLTKICAAELAPYNITVNAYAPGIIHTDMTAPMIEERGHIQVKQIPINRFGKGEEVASLVTFLASEEAGYITGEIIGIDGGMLKVQNPYRAHEYAKSRQKNNI
jgi:3-oxoacyl-[acyl-carrier protein] reductase